MLSQIKMQMRPPEPSTSNAEWTANAERLMSMGEVAFYCKDCDFLTATLEQLQSHEKAGDHSSPSDPRPCPLCTRKPNTPLKSHLLDAHNIADEVAEELMASIPISASGKEIVGLYRHRCAHCPLVFKHGEQLKSHELTHSFRVNHKCPNCTRTFSSVLLLLQHQQDEHSELKCELCSATFGDKQGLDSHLGSVEHLNRTKQFLEDQPNKLQLNEKVMQLLQRSSEDRESPSDKPKPYKCNVCKLNYSQGSTLDIHLRSVGHQNRMNRLNELVKCGEIDASKPVSEQPGGIPQKPIGDLVDNEKALTTFCAENWIPGKYEVVEVVLERDPSLGLGITVAGYVHKKEEISGVFVKSLVPNSSAHLSRQIRVHDLIIEVNGISLEKKRHADSVRTLVKSGQTARLKMIRFAAESPQAICLKMLHEQETAQQVEDIQSDLIDYKTFWQNRLGADYEVVVVDLKPDKHTEEDAGLGLSLEGTVDIVDGTHLCPHHYIESLRKDGPAAKIGILKAGDELLQADASDMNSTENPVNFMNILNMAQFMQLAQNPSTSATDSGLDLSENNGIDLSSILNGQDSKSEEKPKPRKLGQDFRRSLEGYGFELVSQFVDDLKKEKIDFIPDNEILELRQQFDDINKNSVPIDGIQQFAENLKKAVDEVSDDVLIENEDEDGPPEPKRARSDNSKASGQKLPEAKSEFKTELMSQMMNLPFMNNNPFVNMSPDMFQAAFASMLGTQAAPDSPSPNSASQKRARTRITDDQLKILRQYFDINNSPTELQIKEMSNKTGLPEKVIKHWFRNTLFKERQRDKNSPYNFNVQPMMRIDLDTYEKTGEAKIINLKDEEDQKPDEKSDSGSKTPEEQTNLAQDVLANLTQAAAAFNQIPNYAALAGQNPFASFLEQESSQMNQNPLAQLMNGFNSVIPMVSQQSKSSGNSTGRRANRTRFTDFQLRTLQEFFDRQAYPKDDDLEMLSKKLSLSPRVIVVWFQNARQKARKIYENQPNQDNTDRFIRTPGCNFQCKRCQLVFQRYYELIQHQQRVCYANDTDAQNTDNKSVEENMTEEERQKPVSSSQTDEDKRKDSHDNNNTPQDLLKLITGAADSEALMKMFANQAQHKKFSKRCPFCANLFTSKDSMSNHIAHQHSDNPLATTVNVDNLPEADESLSTTEGLLGTISALTGGSPLDLRQKDPRKSSSPFDDLNDNQEADEFSSNGSFDFRALSASPHALLSAFGSPLGSAMGSGMQRSPANGSSASQGGPKRYRTHLTPLQVYVMKSLFTDYKTPSMSECEVLGREIGLHKRVVQVWFQNARAKQRKCGMGAITEEGLCSTHPTGCVECGIDFNGRLTIQDHIFSSQHIGKVKEKGAELRGNEEPIERPKSMKREGEDGGPSEDVALNPLLYTLMDPNMLGTPIQCLQIPEKVMTQIAADLAKGNSSTVFTQDGLELPNLALKVCDEDFKCGTIVESEVGWACPQCSQVFQQEMWLKNHQKLICQGCDGVFRLIQQHYECIPCGQKFGTQDDYRSHCDQSSHKAKRQVFQSPSTCSTSSV
uniref:Zinc finger protein n=1 Tax=Bursaphelenchus xylophilus TaxID=6326 RepID=A0A1I7S1D6_BURXY